MTEIVLLDGAVGQELTHRGQGEDNPLWSTAIMAKAPEMVGDLHLEYFAAGATVASTNTYSVLPDRLDGSALDGRLDELVATAMAEAERATKAYGSGRIAGVLGPLGQSYRPDLSFSLDATMRDYQPLVDAMDGKVSFFLIETISSLGQARNVVDAMDRLTDTPYWLAFSVDDHDGGKLRSGEAVSGISEVVGNASALLLNCSRPEAISTGLPALAGAGVPFGAYANGFTEIAETYLVAAPSVDALTARDDLGPTAYAQTALSWIDAGATIVGGCCEVGPAHIRALHGALISHGYEVI